MVSCEEVQSQFSDFYDNALDRNAKSKLAAHLAQCPDCASQYRAFVRTLDIIRTIPENEPAIDLWPEFSVKMDEVIAEQKLSIRVRLQRSWYRAMGRFAEGVILYTTGLAQRTAERMAKYLISDPFSIKE